MGKPLVGEVVVLPFPQTNLQAGKRRPALVVADLTGAIPLAAADFERGRLAVDSFIRPSRLFTVEQSVILYAAATVKDAKLQQVKAKIRQLFV